MNKYLKSFINICFVISILFLGLILAEYLFSFSIVLPAILETIITISTCFTSCFLTEFCILMYNKNYRELYFKNLLDFYDIISPENSYCFKLAIKTDCIKDLYSNGQITLEQLKQINEEAIYSLKNDEIRNFFLQGLITFKQLDQHDQLKNFFQVAIDNNNIRELFINKQLSFEQLIQLGDIARLALEIDKIRELYINKHLSFEQINPLGWVAKEALKAALNNNAIRNLFKEGLITFEQLKKINHNTIYALEIDIIRNLFINKQLSFEQLNQLGGIARLALETDNIRDLYLNKKLSFEQLNQLNKYSFCALKFDYIITLFINNQLSLEQLNQLEFDARLALKINNIRDLYLNNQLSFEQLNQLNVNARDALEIDKIRELYINKQFSIEQLNQLNVNARDALKIDKIRELYINKQLSFEQLNQLNVNARQALEIDNIRYLFEQRLITFDQIIYCNFYIRDALENDHIRNLFINNYFTFEQLVQYDRNRLIRRLINDLRDDDIYNRIINNEMTWNGFIRNLFQARLQLQNLNDNSQITHTASIHQSVSDSAQALSDRYSQDVINDNVTSYISELKTNIEQFTPNQTITPNIYQAAKRGIARLENLDTDFIDPKSQLSIKKLIALTQIAAKDDDYRQHTYNHYLEAMTLALYEIQRGYNLDASGIDNMVNIDITICNSGTFNKIIEKLVGILPDCHIHFITFETITFKAKQLVKNLIFQFFDDRASLALAKEVEL
ncbi:MAG: hypothetical protein P8L77_00020, partial [Gammaproteobacteria bacterium]|nr:hypothetical protein [Gammaproteobacteria bacterium]